MKHGGDIVSYQHLYDGEIIDFSSNINPLGYPDILNDIIDSDAVSALTRYPDIQYRALRQAVARYLGCGTEEVMLGNGAVDIIDHLCRSASRVVVCIPCFGEYIDRPRIAGKEVLTIPLEKDYTVRASLIESRLKAHDVLLLGNPNNPTGKRIEQQELLRIQALTEEVGAFLALDEAFFEFCPEDYDSIRLFSGKHNVCVIRAATKFFGLPGLRLGYAWAVPHIIRQYQRAALPWRINALADLAGQVIFQETEYIQASKRYIARERQRLCAQLRTVSGIQAYETRANFILLKLLDTDEDTLFSRLIRQGILIRKASSFEGLDRSYVRVAIKDHDSNLRLIQALKQQT